MSGHKEGRRRGIMRKAIRKHRGDRTAIVAKVPTVMVERIDEERAKYGATRLDYVWSVLAQHFDMAELDPLADGPESTDQLELHAPSARPTRAA
jgi:hypothetical protein